MAIRTRDTKPTTTKSRSAARAQRAEAQQVEDTPSIVEDVDRPVLSSGDAEDEAGSEIDFSRLVEDEPSAAEEPAQDPRPTRGHRRTVSSGNRYRLHCSMREGENYLRPGATVTLPDKNSASELVSQGMISPL